MSEERSYRIWIDASGEVWIEDPDAGVLPFAEALSPDYALAAPVASSTLARLARTRAIAAPYPLPDDLAGLWALHDALSETAPGPAPVVHSLLDVKRAIAHHLVQACVLCEHRCGVNRPAGERGICKVGPTSYMASGFVHLAEEREIAPTFCVMMTGCSWHCVYCHTFDIINRVDAGTPLDASLYDRIAAPDVRTLSFVGGNPDQHLPAILDFLATAPPDFDRPIVWNSNMYGSPELYRLLDGVVDVYLGDLRYGNDACAERLSAIPTCVEPVARNWHLAERQGARLIVRLLLLPTHFDCCFAPLVRWLAAELPGIEVSLLDQFHPTYLVGKRAPEMDRTPTPDEVIAARLLLQAAGLREVAAIET